MGNVLKLHQKTGVLCPDCAERMAFLPAQNELRCVKEGCGKGYLRPTAGQMTVRHKNGYTVIEAE